MRVAIVIQPVRDFYFTPQRASFLGAHTLSEILRRNRVDHHVFNAVRGRGRSIPLPVELNYLSPYLGSRHFFSGYNVLESRMSIRPASSRTITPMPYCSHALRSPMLMIRYPLRVH